MTEQTVEQKAQALGWIPKERFKGDPEKFVEAAEYVERGETLLPLVKAHNNRLQGDVNALNGSVTELKNQLKAATEAITALKDSNSEISKQRAKDLRAQLVGQIKTARTEENVDAELALTSQLGEVDSVLRESEQKPIVKEKEKVVEEENAAPPEVVAAFKGWVGDNDWYGKDVRKTGIMNTMAAELRSTAEGRALSHSDFLVRAAEMTEELLTPKGRSGTSKVDAGSNGTGGGSGGKRGKSYADLPADAKTACDKQARDERLVGPDKQFKDAAAYNTYYTSQYFLDEE